MGMLVLSMMLKLGLTLFGSFVFYFIVVIFFAIPYSWLDLSSPSRVEPVPSSVEGDH